MVSGEGESVAQENLSSVVGEIGVGKRKAGEGLGGTIGLENVVTAGPGNSCPLDFICRGQIVG